MIATPSLPRLDGYLKKEEERERPHAVKKLTEKKLLSMDILTD